MSTTARALLFLIVLVVVAATNTASAQSTVSPDAASAAAAEIVVAPRLIQLQFERWRALHQKTYITDQEEYNHRLEVFARNAVTVQRHNEAHGRGWTTYAMSLDGPFADLTNTEFERFYLMNPQNCSATHSSSGSVSTYKKSSSSNENLFLPKAVDWRTRGVVTPIKSQGKCGSCWTFSTTGTLEAHHCIALNKDCTKWTGLAEQQLVDCAGDYNNHGCEGGLPSQAFEYIYYNGGIATEDSYQYKAKDEGFCKTPCLKDIGATLRGVFNITSRDETEIAAAVAFVGPVSVAFDVSSDFRLYSHGVYDSFNATTNKTMCSLDAQHVNHAVVAVGYGETMGDDPPVPFHIIRNSWGNTWGMEGYFWMLRGENMCGISDCASFPLVPKPDDVVSKQTERKHLRK